MSPCSSSYLSSRGGKGEGEEGRGQGFVEWCTGFVEQAQGEEDGGRARNCLGSRLLQQLFLRHFPHFASIAMPVRDRNKTKFTSWGIYFTDEDRKKHPPMFKKLRESAKESYGRVPGGQSVALEVKRISGHKVEITWPAAVGEDACTVFLKKALCSDWSNVSQPAGVPRTDDAVPAYRKASEPALTTEEAESAFDDAKFATDIEAALADKRASPWPCPEPAAAAASSSAGISRGSAATAETIANLLSLKLEELADYWNEEQNKYDEPPNSYSVSWDAELGQGMFGKVFLGTNTEVNEQVLDRGAVAIKMMGSGVGGGPPVVIAQDEVRRHVTLGSHRSLVQLLDVGLFVQPLGQGPKLVAAKLQQSGKQLKSYVSLGLVFDLFETDVRQYLQTGKRFTTGGTQHVLSSVLDGLAYMHGKGLVHSDMKPANILMRGTPAFRGCFGRKPWAAQPAATATGDLLEFEYQVPASFQARPAKFNCT